MKRCLWAFTAVFFWVVLVGMAKTPGPEVPMPEIDFKATVRDNQDIATKLNHATWDGNIFFNGTRGKGTVTISFEKIKKVTAIGSGSGNKSDFQITLKDGAVVAVSLDNDSQFQGSTNFGSYRIGAKDIKEISFE